MQSTKTCERLLTIKQVTLRIPIAEPTIRRNLSKGRWPFHKVGRRTLIAESFVDSLIESGYHPATAVPAK